MTNSLKICLTKSQTEFYQVATDVNVKFPLFVGGPGSGKSYILGFCAVLFAQHSKDADIYIYAPEHHHIRTIEVPNILYWLDQFKIKNKGYNAHENKIETSVDTCGTFYFKPMDNPATFVGYQSYAAFIDELDTLPEEKAEDVWRKVLERNRQQPKNVPEEFKKIDSKTGRVVCINKALAFTTPEGYNFCYKTWELNKLPGYELIRTSTQDNTTLDSDYEDTIKNSYPPHIAEAYLRGEFVNMRSSAVYFNYNPELHNSFEVIQEGEPLYIGCDFNVDNTSATIYVKRNGKEWHAVEELCGLKDAATLADLLLKKYKTNSMVIYPDSSGKNRTNANASISALNEFTSRGLCVKAPKANFRIEDRTAAMNTALSKGLVYINMRNCPMVSRCLINQPFGKDGKPCKKTGYDHQNDATTYPIVYEMGPTPKLFTIPFTFLCKE